jgi:hypothetical protein
LNIHLTDWVALAEHETLPDKAGVYTIADAEPGGVIYIGRTWGNDGLRGRLRAFMRSARSGQSGHAGGVTYHKKFGSNLGGLRASVHVPLVIKERPPQILYAYLQHVERRLIWEFVERWGSLPVCNSE